MNFDKETHIRMAQVALDLHEALDVKWGDDPYAEIKRLKENDAYAVSNRSALERIASRGVAPRVRPTGEKQAFGCHTCGHWWDEGKEEHHDEHCAYVIARAALAKNPTEKGGFDSRSLAEVPVKTGEGFESPDVARGAKGPDGTSVKASAESGAGAKTEYEIGGSYRAALLNLADATRDTLRTHPETECCTVTRRAVDEAYALLDVRAVPESAPAVTLHTPSQGGDKP